MAKNFAEMSKAVIEQVGGKENVASFSHCVTRLRFTVKDKSLVNDAAMAKVNGVIGTQWLGDQYQVIVGNDVDDIYSAACQMFGFAKQDAVNENLDPELNKGFSLKKVFNGIMAYTSPTMTGVIPLMVAVCMCKMLTAVFGSSMLGIMDDAGDLAFTLNMIYNAFFYFMPVFLGYSAAKALNINPLYGIFCGTIIIVPDFVGLVGVRETLSVFGVNAPVAAYGSSFLPVMIGVWLMSYLVKALNKSMPSVLKPIFTPTIVVLVTTFVMLVVCAPLGSLIGNLIGNFFNALANSNVVVRLVGSVLLAIAMPYMVLGGMHGALLNFAIMTWITNGFETFTLPIMTAYNFAVFGIALGGLLKIKGGDNKASMLSYFLTGILGSVTEPILFGVVVKYKNGLKALLVASIALGLYVGLLQPCYYNMAGATIMTFFVPWAGGTAANMAIGCGLIAVAFFGAAAASYLMVDYSEE